MKKITCVILILTMMIGGCAKLEEDGKTTTETSEQADRSATEELFAMDTYMTLTANDGQAQEAVKAAAEEINRIDALLSTGKEDSEISQINKKGSGSVSEETKELIETSVCLSEKTGGLFDITIYPVMREWGFTNGDFHVPEEEELKVLLSHMGTDKISLDTEKNQLFLDEAVEIDLGGIAKGYTSNRVMDIFKEYGVTSGVISLGGNVQTLGVKTDGTKWRVAIQKPGEDNEYIGVLSVEDKAVITSGGYERYFEEDGKKWHHIIDPRTGYPAESGLVSVTIVGSDGTMADGLSTSLFIMGKDQAIEFWHDNREDFEMVLVDEEENIFVSEGLSECFESDYDFTIIE